jgi:hypothetical protein
MDQQMADMKHVCYSSGIQPGVREDILGVRKIKKKYIYIIS